MNPRESLSGLDSAFLSLETPTTPTHIVGVLVIDASNSNGGYPDQRALRLVAQRAPGLAPFHAAGARPTAANALDPLMKGAGVNITVMRYAGSVDSGIVAYERAEPDASDIALGLGTAVADLHEIALEKTRTAPRSCHMRIAPNATPPPVASN